MAVNKPRPPAIGLRLGLFTAIHPSQLYYKYRNRVLNATLKDFDFHK